MTGSPQSFTPVADFDPANYTDNAVRQAHKMLLKEVSDQDEALRLVAQTCKRSKEEIQRILDAPPEPRPMSGRDRAQIARTRLSVAPSPAAMMALKQFAQRDKSVNVTILGSAHLKDAPPDGLDAALAAGGFKRMPDYEQQHALQQAILQYVATVMEVRPEHMFCCVKNARIEGAEGKVGRLSAPGGIVDDTDFEPHVLELRDALEKLQPPVSLHYLCLPPLDLSKLTTKSRTMILDKASTSGDTRPSVEVITGQWLRARSRDNVFIAWVQRTWPNGGPLNEIINAIEFADWLISLLAYTRYRPRFPHGKKMLVQIACLCANRAQTWCADVLGKEAIEAAEAWLKEPSKEIQDKAGVAAERVKEASSIGGHTPGGGPGAYIQQAVRESAVRAAMAAHTHDAGVVGSCAARAAASAVMAASFSNAGSETEEGDDSKSDSWLKMIGAAAAPGEAAENRWLCDEIRKLVDADESQ